MSTFRMALVIVISNFIDLRVYWWWMNYESLLWWEISWTSPLYWVLLYDDCFEALSNLFSKLQLTAYNHHQLKDRFNSHYPGQYKLCLFHSLRVWSFLNCLNLIFGISSNPIVWTVVSSCLKMNYFIPKVFPFCYHPHFCHYVMLDCPDFISFQS